jgi:hypothetical protein
LKRLFVLLVSAICIAACGSTQVPAVTPSPAATQVPTATPTVDHPVTSIQEGAQYWSHGPAKSGMKAGIVWVTDDLTNYHDPFPDDPHKVFGLVETIKFDCYNIQQALWYGLESVNNADGSTTTVKSHFREIDITFIVKGRGGASCRLISKTVDKIDKAGMWDDGDFDGAWKLYDSTSLEV